MDQVWCSHKEDWRRSPAASHNNMKYKSFAVLAVTCGVGVAFFAFRSGRPTFNSSTPSAEAPTPSQPAITKAPSRAIAEAEASPARFAALALTNKLFRTAEALWREPVTEPAFARFKDWTDRYLATDAASRAGLVAEGVELAGARRENGP